MTLHPPVTRLQVRIRSDTTALQCSERHETKQPSIFVPTEVDNMDQIENITQRCQTKSKYIMMDR